VISSRSADNSNQQGNYARRPNAAFRSFYARSSSADPSAPNAAGNASLMPTTGGRGVPYGTVVDNQVAVVDPDDPNNGSQEFLTPHYRVA
jgi:hypothetical protein